MRSRWRTAGFVLGAWCACTFSARAGDDPPAPVAADRLATEVRLLLAQFCSQCHSGADPEGGLSLDRFPAGPSLLTDRKVWLAVSQRLHDAEMPPDGEPQPTAEQVAGVVNWLDEQIAAAERRQPRNPGRVTIRRLNRAEYNNTIRDLVGVDFKPADDFPSDDVGYGFDNIGDVLSLPPLLLEKYLAAAQSIVQRALVAHPGPRSIANLAGHSDDVNDKGLSYGSGGWHFTKNASFQATVRSPADGQYVVKSTAYGQQAGPEPARMAIEVDGKQIGLVDVAAEKTSPQTYELPVELAAGEHRLAVAFVNDYYSPQDPNPANRDRNLVVVRMDVDTLLPMTFAELPDSHRQILERPPGEGESAAERSELARRIIARFTARAFRRPVSEAEIERLVKVFELGASRGDNFVEGIQLALAAVLVSPHFLFRLELDPESIGSVPAGAAGVRSLNDYEIATRLSYALWSSMPDDQLFAAAQAGRLREPDQLAQQARRMLGDARSRALVDNFATQWLQLRNLKYIAPDKKLFPDFDESLRSAMRQESEHFFALVVSEDRSVLDFLDADFTLVNERLARHYGIAGIQGDEFRRVTFEGNRRGGVLGQASMLAITSNPTRTSPVKRGRWVLDNLLGAAPPPPPPGVPDLVDAAAGELHGSLRERMQQHRSKAECAVCHNRMDPLGFGLENFDALGAWRTHDGPLAIDSSGTLPGGKTFSGPAELRQILKSKEKQFVRCLAEKLLTYALGRGLEDYDRPAVSDIVDQSAAGGYRFSSLMVAVIQSDPFTKCRTTGANP